MAHAAHENDSAIALVDDCWNRIGTRGDGSCPRLAEHMRCVNCPVFEQAAARLLERSASDADTGAQAAPAASPAPLAHDLGPAAATQAALAFRVGDEWLALPAAALHHVEAPRPIHSLPHRRNPVVLGLVNVRGTLTVAASLGGMLNLDRPAAVKHAARQAQASPRTCARMLVAAHRGEVVAFPVDEVEGMLRFAASELMPVPATLAHAAASHVRGVLSWRGVRTGRGTTIGLLDMDRLFASLGRSLR